MQSSYDDLKYGIIPSPTFDRALKGFLKRDKPLVNELWKQVDKLVYYPEIGKPLRYLMRTYRRLHVSGSFVLVYEISGRVIYLIDFGHHDKIYKKYK